MNRPIGCVAFGLGLLLLLGGSARAGDLFGDLPAFLERVAGRGEGPLQDRAREFEQVLRSIETRATSEASLTGSSPGGFRYVLNDLGLPERQTTGVGSLFIERADSLGPQKFSLSFSYTHLDYREFSGDALDDLFDLKDERIGGELFSDLELETDIFTAAAAYGITDRWDVGALVPYVWHRSDGRLLLKRPDMDLEEVADMEGASHGLGDIVLFSKVNVLRTRNDWSWSLGAKLKLPTGDQDDFLGTGETDVTLRTLLSKRIESIELNSELGYTFSGFGREYDYLTYNFGVNYSPTDWFTLVAEFLGSESDLAIYDTRDFAGGVRFNLWDNVVIQGAARVPLDDSGLRTRVTPLVKVEWKF